MSDPQKMVSALLDAAQDAVKNSNPLPVVQCLTDASYFLACCPRESGLTKRLSFRLIGVERAYKALLTDLLCGTAGVEWTTITRRTKDPKLKWLEGEIRKLRIPTRRCGESYHAPKMQVPSTFVREAEDIVFRWDDEPGTFTGPGATMPEATIKPPPAETDDNPAPDFFGLGSQP